MGQISLPQLPPVKKGISWRDLFGDTVSDVSAETRRERWNEAKSIATASERTAIEDEFEDCEHRDCEHFDGGWCSLQGLPAGFNPVMQACGMACMGAGYQRKRPARRKS